MQAAFADDWVGQASRRYHEARVRLLRKLRFGATILMICGVFAGYLGAIPGINVPVLSVVAAITLLFNLAVILDWVPCQKTDSAIPPGAMHAIVDMLLLTLVLWAIGGVHAPFLSNFVFHVAIVGILGGGRATILGACIAMLCTFLLSLTHYVPGLAIAVWNPRPPFDALSEFAAFSTVIIAIAYVTLDAVLELRRREEALRRAAEAVAIEYDVLTRTLRTIDAGLEVIGEGGVVLFENPRAAVLRQAAQANESPQDDGRAFSVFEENGERIYEKKSFELSSAHPSLEMNLYLDRTDSLMEEQKLLHSERLASLGRLTQGIAHDLNTPLSTIRTLAADMQSALRSCSGSHPCAQCAPVYGVLRADLTESAKLIQEETERLARITKGLLAGGDLVRSRESSAQTLVHAAVERALVLVRAGNRNLRVEVGEGVAMQRSIARADEVVQILVNLLQNSADAIATSREHGAHQAAIDIRIEAADAEDFIEITLTDFGPGFSDEVKDRVFQPFVTSKPVGQGTGLGLYTSQLWARSIGGTLDVKNQEGAGVRATLRIPQVRCLTPAPGQLEPCA